MSNFGVSGKPSYRSNNALGFFICVASLAVAQAYIDPLIAQSDCALCSVIRIILLLMSGLFLISFLINRSVYFQRFVAVIHLLLITGGVITTLRSLFVDPDNLSSSCELSTSSLLEQGSFNSFLTTLNNAATCPYPDWQVYQLSVAHLSLILMLVLLVIVWKIVIKKPQRNLFF
ncbi:disulfide bond formation protein B [Amphritea sp. 2_MG-2023]|uniref:disulfide bond formation protein B n=1 Tax=Amphritea TaxID=515417 RepID=UPI001C07C684|nr:disulfide bond formation protein B [Amphritea sp. 2_MG-2023]MBU2967345.1 disulfide bond formation protein B [Amphritea atlantica]MDO6418400.1 disulfide bond formation protein B [Amphritea sp. 2_MG-2023]MDX2422562.1 disulfide bond formation protein B [Amphritea sp.]